MIKRTTVGVFLLMLSSQFLFSQEKLSENQKLETLGKVWGFLKYYHPNVAKGTFNWDNQLIEKIKETEKIDTKKQFNKMISEWIDGLGKVEICKTCNEKNDKKYFLKNFDLNWTDDENTFSKNVIEKLNFIEENRNIDGDFYYSTKKDDKGYFGVRNEKQYDENFPDKETRLLELFRYWNLVEYFFPYKYQTDQNWNDVLTEMIPKLIEVKDRREYLLTFAKTVAKINDTHAFFMVANKNMFHGNSQVPIQTKFLGNQLIVTDFYTTKNSYSQVLQKFDIIKKIDGKMPQEIQDYYAQYIPASNKWTLIKKISDLYLYSFKDKIKLEIIRNNQSLEVEAETVKFTDINYPQPKKIIEKWQLLDGNKKIGYADMGILEKTDVDKMYVELKDTDYIIFDIRNYPKGTAINIMNLLSNEPKQFCDMTIPDVSYPGKYYFLDKNKFLVGNKENTSPYQGKLIVLVNETTQSHAEFSTMMFQSFKNTKVIGSNTAGADGNVVKFDLAKIHTQYTGLGVFYPDGRETQRIGIIPDIEVKPTIKGLQENRDEVLERALTYIATGK